MVKTGDWVKVLVKAQDGSWAECFLPSIEDAREFAVMVGGIVVANA